jgi:nucleotide-binding universal stress UspA family protein
MSVFFEFKIIILNMPAAKKILVPVDLSGNSESAVIYAAGIARQSGAKVYLFHTALLPDFYVSELDDYNLYDDEFKTIIKRIHAASLSRLQDMRKKYFDENSGVICKAILAKNIYNEILDYSEKLQPDYVIMGEGDRKDKIRIGSNTERVLRLTDMPVIVVKKQASAKIKKVVFASDFHKDSIGVFKNANAYLENFQNASVRLLYINTKSKFEEYDEVKSRIENFKKNFSFDFSIVIRAGKNIESSIVRYANSINADMIVMGIKRKKRIPLYFTDRITEGVINLSDIPVFAVNNP